MRLALSVVAYLLAVLVAFVLGAVVSPRAPVACWDAADTLGVYASCRRAEAGHDACVCYTRELMKISPDPEARATDEEHARALAACGLTRVETSKAPMSAEGQVDL